MAYLEASVWWGKPSPYFFTRQRDCTIHESREEEEEEEEEVLEPFGLLIVMLQVGLSVWFIGLSNLQLCETVYRFGLWVHH